MSRLHIGPEAWSRAWHKCASKWREKWGQSQREFHACFELLRNETFRASAAECERDAARAELAEVRARTCETCASYLTVLSAAHGRPCARGHACAQHGWHCADWRAKGG